MKILVVSQYYFPEPFKIHDICRKLVLDGHSVTVLTGLPNYPSGIIPDEYRHGKKRTEEIDGVHVIRVPLIPRRKGAVSLALNYLSFMISATWKTHFLPRDFDVIFCYQLSPVLMAHPAWRMKRRIKKQLFLYCLDLWPESMKNMISSSNHPLFRFLGGISRKLYSRCDRIGVTSSPFVRYFVEEHHLPESKMVYIPQHGDESLLEEDFSSGDSIIDFLFMGNIGIAQDIECILSAVEKIKNIPNFRVHFVGDGSLLEDSQKKVEENGLNDLVIFHGRHPQSEMGKYYKLADVCLLTLKDDSWIGKTVPGKMQGYMAAGKPILGAINGSAKEIIQDAKCGLWVPASDADSLSEAMKSIIDNPGSLAEWGRNSREYFLQNFTFAAYMNRIENEMSTLTQETKL